MFFFKKILVFSFYVDSFSKALMHTFIKCVYDNGKQNILPKKEWIFVLKFCNMKTRIAFI